MRHDFDGRDIDNDAIRECLHFATADGLIITAYAGFIACPGALPY